MTPAEFPRVAVIGSGVIGRSWTAVFARAGCPTTLFDPEEGQLTRAMAWLQEQKSPEWAAIQPCARLDQALDGALYVQECGPEHLETKQRMFADLDRAAARAA